MKVLNKFKFTFLSIIVFYSVAGSVWAQSADWYYESRQVTDAHRYELRKMGGHWGHHLSHLIRTASGEVWYGDDTGTNVYRNPAAVYHRLGEFGWEKVLEIPWPSTIQQNTAHICIGDTIYSYGLNVNGGYIEELVLDTRTLVWTLNTRVLTSGTNTNYIGAAVSPGGTRVVWWTGVVDGGGPAPWTYSYNKGDGWVSPITTMVPGNDFSYNFVSFINDTSFFIGGEFPIGDPPNWRFVMGVARVVLGHPATGIQSWEGINNAHSVWVNPANGDAHLFGQSATAFCSYHYRAVSDSLFRDMGYLDIGTLARLRSVQDDSGKLYLLFASNGMNMVVFEPEELTGPLNATGKPIIKLNYDYGYDETSSLFAEAQEFQTNPVPGLQFVHNGSDFAFSNILRHVQVLPNTENVPYRLSWPNGGEAVEGGDNVRISWYHNPDLDFGNLQLEHSVDGGATWTEIASPVNPALRSFNWVVPEIDSDSCLIRIWDLGGIFAPSVSEGFFSQEYTYIAPIPPSVPIISPKDSVTVERNEELSITGTGSDVDGYILRYEWDMADGTAYAGLSKKSVTHSYADTGRYVVTFVAKDNDGNWSDVDEPIVIVKNAVGINNAGSRPESFGLSTYPNPFNASSQIDLFLVQSANIDLDVSVYPDYKIDEFAAHLVRNRYPHPNNKKSSYDFLYYL